MRDVCRYRFPVSGEYHLKSLHVQVQHWLCSGCTSCTRIHHRWALHSCLCMCCRCLGRTCITSFRCGSQVPHRRRCPSSQTREARSCETLRERWTCCILPSTSCCYVAAGQISACKDRWVSVDWASRFESSTCLASRWTRLQTPPTNDWKSQIHRRFAGLAPECSWLHNTQWYQLLN